MQQEEFLEHTNSGVERWWRPSSRLNSVVLAAEIKVFVNCTRSVWTRFRTESEADSSSVSEARLLSQQGRKLFFRWLTGKGGEKILIISHLNVQ